MSSCGDDWKNQDGMTEHTISDDGRKQIDLPFTYNFDGNNYTTSWMHSNGVVQFMSPQSSFCCSGYDVENGNWENWTGLPFFSYSIAALWTDLIDLNRDFDGDGVDDTGFFTQEVDTNGDGDIDAVRYLWRNISEYYDPTTANTFGAEITSSGGAEIHHFQIEIKNHAVTVGIFGDPREGQIQQYEYYAYNEDFVSDEYTIYSFDLAGACAASPLISTNCEGYAAAYAELVYQQNCAADPLYDLGCTGYEQAYYTQQCRANPLYAETCPGYEEAYYAQQCELNPLYDTGCSGYEQAYFNQQCRANPLYDPGCAGYEQAYYETYVLPDLERQTAEASGTSTEESQTTPEVVDAQSFTETSITGDAVIDDILNEEVEIVLVPVIEEPVVEPEPITEPIVEEQVEEPVEEIQIAELEESVEEIEEIETAPVEEEADEEEQEEIQEPSGNVEESVDDDTGDGNSTGDERAEDNDDKETKKDSKRDKIKKILVQRAKKLAEKMGEAASYEQQQMIQAQIAALIAYVPGFKGYGGSISGGTYPDAQLYQTEQIPESKRGLRNGLAQQLLHEKMVEMQYK